MAASVGPPGPESEGTLATVPSRVIGALRRAGRGVVVLAVDGLPYPTAAGCWPDAALTRLTSTVPSTSTTGWLTAVTGLGPADHGVPGMVYQIPRDGTLIYAVTGQVLARGPADATDRGGPVVAGRTMFERAAGWARCVALGRELDHLDGPWAPALLAGADRIPARPAAELAAAAADPVLLATQIGAEVDAELARPSARPVLLWAYLNLDDHLHRYGPDERVTAALRALGGHAQRWAESGWTVICHSDHGQVRCVPDPDLCSGWDDLDRLHCALPSGGAGRIRWMYPRPGHQERLATRLGARLGDTATVLDADRFAALGGMPMTPLLRGRIGSVVAVAASERFPVPDPSLRYEHGGLHPDEMAVPFVTWPH